MNKTAAPKTTWTRAEVEARYEAATGEKAQPTDKSIDLWVWASEARQAQREKESAR